jgi:hypothetical protein
MQEKTPETTSQKVTVTVAKPTGQLTLTVDGKAKTIAAKDVANYWMTKAGAILYSVRERKRGYEGEGEALFLYDRTTETKTRLLTDDYMIEKVYELTTTGGKSLLCVTMSDGGLGANHVAIVNPERGTVFAQPMSRFARVEPNRIIVAEWADSDRWHGADEPRGKPTAYLTFSPDRVLKQRAVRDRPWR